MYKYIVISWISTKDAYTWNVLVLCGIYTYMQTHKTTCECHCYRTMHAYLPGPSENDGCNYLESSNKCMFLTYAFPQSWNMLPESVFATLHTINCLYVVYLSFNFAHCHCHCHCHCRFLSPSPGCMHLSAYCGYRENFLVRVFHFKYCNGLNMGF